MFGRGGTTNPSLDMVLRYAKSVKSEDSLRLYRLIVGYRASFGEEVWLETEVTYNASVVGKN